MSEYIFEKQKENKETQRLRLLETAFDAATIAGLKKTGISAGWRCLEIGAGAGSIARWMTEQVGATGSVVAIDKDTSHLQALDDTHCEIIQGDFLHLPFNIPFDVIHCRYVLIHNQQDLAMLKKIRSLLKPGGCVLLEEPDFTSALKMNPASELSAKKVNQAICTMFRDLKLDPMYGISLPNKLSQTGYEIIDLDAALHFCRGNTPVAKLMAASADALREKYIGSGEANEGDIETYIKHAANDDYWSVYYTTISVRAKAAE